MKYLLNTAILIGLAAYVVAFYVTPLPELQNDAGQPLWRIQLVGLLLSLPDEWLFSNWFGSPPQFSLGDRLPVLLVAGLILAWAAALGWLLMVLLRRLCGAGVSPAPIKQLGCRRLACTVGRRDACTTTAIDAAGDLRFRRGRGAQCRQHLGAVAGAVRGVGADVGFRGAGDRDLSGRGRRLVSAQASRWPIAGGWQPPDWRPIAGG